MKRATGFCNLLKDRQEFAHVGDLLDAQQDERIFHQSHLLVWVVDEVGRQKSRGQTAYLQRLRVRY